MTYSALVWHIEDLSGILLQVGITPVAFGRLLSLQSLLSLFLTPPEEPPPPTIQSSSVPQLSVSPCVLWHMCDQRTTCKSQFKFSSTVCVLEIKRKCAWRQGPLPGSRCLMASWPRGQDCLLTLSLQNFISSSSCCLHRLFSVGVLLFEMYLKPVEN